MNLSLTLLAIMLIVFVLQLVFPAITNTFVFVPDYAFSEPWRFFTSMFLHDGFLHILFNGYALFMFGSMLERRVSKKDFLTIFFVGGLMAGLFYYLTVFSPWPPLCEAPDGGVWACPALGASGAVYAILGACAMLLPEMVVYLWFFPVKMRYAWIIWMLIEIVGAVSPGTGIANAAHLGGLIFGLIYGWYLSKKEQAFYQPTWETRDTTWEQA